MATAEEAIRMIPGWDGTLASIIRVTHHIRTANALLADLAEIVGDFRSAFPVNSQTDEVLIRRADAALNALKMLPHTKRITP